MLDLKVLDPAMGSGHFLVTAVDFLSDYIADLIEYVPVVPGWLDGPYESPLVGRIAAIRSDILRRAGESDWVMDEAQLTDQAIIRRMVLKRCIYGVDKSPLTVELAKVSLWLHSFTVGAPLSFLDHHLRCGDSLLGLSVTEATADLNRLGGLFASSAIAGAEAAAGGMRRIEEMSDADVAEVRESAQLFLGSRGCDGGPALPARFPVRPALADLWHEEEGARLHSRRRCWRRSASGPTMRTNSWHAAPRCPLESPGSLRCGATPTR